MSLTKAHNRMIEGSQVNVIDFGAVGDGVTDSTSAIQSALTAGSAFSRHLYGAPLSALRPSSCSLRPASAASLKSCA